MKGHIVLTPAEIQSGFDRQRQAELLILQLPADHDGRNTWLLNYGIGQEAVLRRACRPAGFPVTWDPETNAARTANTLAAAR